MKRMKTVGFWCGLSAERFVVVDKLWHNWAQYHMPGVAEMMQVVVQWPLAFAADDVRVYENPNLNE